MALVVADRVQETTTTSGTGTFNLAGAVAGFKTFVSGIGTTNTTYYAAYDQTAQVWEVGLGTVMSGSPDTLSRDTVLSNSSGTTAKISFAGNTTYVWCDYPTAKAVYLDASNQLNLTNASGYNIYASGAAANYFAGNTQIQGNFALGIAPDTSIGAYQYRTALTGTTSYGNLNVLVAASTNTAGIRGFNTSIGTAASAFTLSNIFHYQTTQGTIGAGSTVTNQFGFSADSSLTGATNNYGFYSNIASGTGRYNFYAAGTADNYFAGPVVVSTSSSSDALRITQTGAGNALVVEDSANPDATPFVVDASGILGVGLTNPAAYTVAGAVFKSSAAYSPQIYTWNAANDTSASYLLLQKDRGGAIVQSGDGLGNIHFRGFDGANFIRGAAIEASVDGTPGTNDMPGRLVFSTTADGASSPTERMRIDSAGQVGIGGAATLGYSLQVRKNIVGSTYSAGIIQSGQIQSSVTSEAASFYSYPSTQATAFTLSALKHYTAAQGTLGAGSTVNNQYGFIADSSLTGATNNYGFYSNIASSSGRWNFYAAGSAANYFAGDLTIYGGTAVPAGGTAGTGYKFSSTANLGVFFGSGAPTLSAAQGSLYIRTDGSSTSTRLYVNTNGSTTWTNVTTAA